MVNKIKKYTTNNPRVVISTRKNIKDWLHEKYPETQYNTDHKRLTKIKEDLTHIKDKKPSRNDSMET